MKNSRRYFTIICVTCKHLFTEPVALRLTISEFSQYREIFKIIAFVKDSATDTVH